MGRRRGEEGKGREGGDDDGEGWMDGGLNLPRQRRRRFLTNYSATAARTRFPPFPFSSAVPYKLLSKARVTPFASTD